MIPGLVPLTGVSNDVIFKNKEIEAKLINHLLLYNIYIHTQAHHSFHPLSFMILMPQSIWYTSLRMVLSIPLPPHRHDDNTFVFFVVHMMGTRFIF